VRTEWIVVADASQARLLRRERDDEPLVAVSTWRHGASRDKPSETGDDRPGHGATDWRPGGTRFEPRLDPRRKEHLRFAAEIAARLEHAAAQGEFGRLTVYAPAEFLGELRAALGRHAQERLRVAVDVDLVAYGLDELERRIGRALHAREARGIAPP
jgi:protein required for attachment to host cells